MWVNVHCFESLLLMHVTISNTFFNIFYISFLRDVTSKFLFIYIGCRNDWLSGVCKRIGDIISKHLCADEKCLLSMMPFFYFVEKMYVYWSHFLMSSCKGFKFHIKLSLWNPRIKNLESCHKDIGCQKFVKN